MTEKSITITADRLDVRYSELPALSISHLCVTGRVIALLGHNGAGKSTLIKTVLGLLEPSSGRVVLTNTEGRDLRPERDLAFCPENGAIFADIAVERYLECWCRIAHNNARHYRDAGSKYVERLGIVELLGKRGRELSKGQRRRVQTALGFMSDPSLFLFDEPFDGLDVQRTNDLMEIVEEERAHRAFIISSHRMDVMERLADSIIVLRHGEVACSGSVPEVRAALVEGSSEGSLLDLTDAMRMHLQELRQRTVANSQLQSAASKD
jgi:ABC-2 type transport system ATP-binding protein